MDKEINCSENDIPISPQGQFQLLWNSINSKRGYSWQVNPYVWTTLFRRIE